MSAALADRRAPAHAERREARVAAPRWRALARCEDPELPALSIVDLGIVRFVKVRAGRRARGRDSLRPTPVARRPSTSRSSARRRARGRRRGSSSRSRRCSRPHGAATGSRPRGAASSPAYGIVPPAPAARLVRRALAREPARRLSAMRLGRHRMHSASSARRPARRCTVAAIAWSRSSASSAFDGIAC